MALPDPLSSSNPSAIALQSKRFPNVKEDVDMIDRYTPDRASGHKGSLKSQLLCNIRFMQSSEHIPTFSPSNPSFKKSPIAHHEHSRKDGGGIYDIGFDGVVIQRLSISFEVCQGSESSNWLPTFFGLRRYPIYRSWDSPHPSYPDSCIEDYSPFQIRKALVLEETIFA